MQKVKYVLKNYIHGLMLIVNLEYILEIRVVKINRSALLDVLIKIFDNFHKKDLIVNIQLLNIVIFFILSPHIVNVLRTADRQSTCSFHLKISKHLGNFSI